MRSIIITLLLTAASAFGAEAPVLSDAQKLQIREAQLAQSRITAQALSLKERLDAYVEQENEKIKQAVELVGQADARTSIVITNIFDELEIDKEKWALDPDLNLVERKTDKSDD